MLKLRLLPRSLVGRVFALYTVVLVGFVGISLTLFYRYQFTVEVEDAQGRAEALASVLMPTVSDSAVIGDYDTIRRTLERSVLGSSFSQAVFIDVSGGVVRAPRNEPPEVVPPDWLRDAMARQLYDTNEPISVGGRDYGVLRLSFAADRIAGKLWQQTRFVLAVALVSVGMGLLLIRVLLGRWLGNLGRIKDFEEALQSGEATPAMLAAEQAPTEFRDTFEVLGRAAANLQSQRAQAAVTLSAIADGVFTLDPLGRIVFANPAACAMTGLDGPDLMNRAVGQVLPEVVEAAGGTLQPWLGRRLTLGAGTHHAVVMDTTLSPIQAPDGSTAGYVLACRDVSEQHGLDQRLRAELRQRETALESLRQVLEGLTGDAPSPARGADDLAAISAMISVLVQRLQVRGEQLDAIFALSPDGFVSFDAARRANYVSPAFSRLTGLPEASVLGATEAAIEERLRRLSDAAVPWRGFDGLRLDPPAGSAAAPAQPRRALIELARPQRRVLEIGLRQGTTEAISQVLSLRDVTHESEVDQMKSEFLSTAAHELRTPMASIFGFVELLMMRNPGPELRAEMLGTIHRQTKLMIAIVNELLDLARIEARRGADFRLETLDLVELVTEALAEFNPPQDRALPLLEGPQGLLPVRVDRNKMRQALGNVLSNAYKYSPQGGAVQMRIVTEGQELGVQVQDSGIGMTPEQLARVSERFYRADTSGSIPGTGLGMSIVKEIVELLGGRMALASEPGVGTTVTLWLPAAACAWADPA